MENSLYSWYLAQNLKLHVNCPTVIKNRRITDGRMGGTETKSQVGISAFCAVIVLIVAFVFLRDEVNLLQNSSLEAATYTGCDSKIITTSRRGAGSGRTQTQYATVAVSESGVKVTGPYIHPSSTSCQKRMFRETGIFVHSLDTKNSRINSFFDFWLLPFVLTILFIIFAVGTVKQTVFGNRLRYAPSIAYLGGAIFAVAMYWMDYERAAVSIAAANGIMPNSTAEFPDDFLDHCIRNTMKEGGYRHEVEIQTLRCQEMRLTSLARLEGLQGLEQLYLQGNKLTSLESMPKLPSLKVLSIASNETTSLSGIENAPALQELQSNKNKVASIEELSALKDLQTVAFMFNNVSDLTPLETLQELRSINFNYNKISDISALSNKPKLAEINLFSNAINDISPLYGNDGLEMLGLVGRKNTIQCDQVDQLLRRVSFKIHDSWREYCH